MAPDKDVLRAQIRLVDALLRSMDAAGRGEGGPSDLWTYSAYRDFARKYNQVVLEIAKTTELPAVLDTYDVDQIAGNASTLPFQRKEIFDSVYTNASLLKALLEGKLGVVDDAIDALRDFLKARLRSALFSPPSGERDVQDAIETLLIGRGLQKGEDYDREVGRVKVSAKEVIPDFVFPKLQLALEVKLIVAGARVRVVIDEINADIRSYSKQYRSLLFIVHDLGFIRDEVEFRQDLEGPPNVSVVVVKQ